jgi:maltodextrin utilization protein YvdJ
MVTLLPVCIHFIRKNGYAVACMYTFYQEEWLRCCLFVYILLGGMVTLLPVCIHFTRRNGYAVACVYKFYEEE